MAGAEAYAAFASVIPTAMKTGVVSIVNILQELSSSSSKLSQQCWG
jgi:hypothetical protein